MKERINTNGQKVRELWKASEMTIAEMAKTIGVKENTLKSWCFGRRNPPDYVLNMIIERMQQKKSDGSENTLSQETMYEHDKVQEI